ncbi:putative DNA-binding protein [Clostridium sardiniense]
MMEDRVEISLLMDFYKPLLTEKQKNIMELYFEDDLSLAEIAELNNTSRQAIHDLIKRCYKQLLTYEEKLGLLQKSINREEKIIKLLKNFKEKYSISNKEYDMLKKELEDL